MNDLIPSITEFISTQSTLTYLAAALFVLLLVVLLSRGLIRRRARIRREQLDPYRITLEDIDLMEGSLFERYLHRFFVELGYEHVYKTQESKDFGADLVFTDREGFRHVLQAKRYEAKSRIGLSAVQEIYASMRYYEADRAIVLSSASFTSSCEILAGVNGVTLLDRNDLMALIQDFKSGSHDQAMDRIEREPESLLSPWSTAADAEPMKPVQKQPRLLSRKAR